MAKERRYVTLLLSTEEVEDSFHGGLPSSRFPDGARVIRMHVEPLTQSLHMVLEHESFKPVKPGTLPPYI